MLDIGPVLVASGERVVTMLTHSLTGPILGAIIALKAIPVMRRLLGWLLVTSKWGANYQDSGPRYRD